MEIHLPSEHGHPAPSHRSRRGVIGRALGLALSGAAGWASVAAAAKPASTRQASTRQPTPGDRRPGAGRRRRRRRRYRVVTRAFSSTVPITIPEKGPASPYPATIQVGGLRAGKILDLNVTLSGLTHGYPGELEVVLVAPSGQAVVLMSDAGAQYDVTNLTLAFDDQAASFLPIFQMVSGSYKPTLPGFAPRPENATLRTFTGLNPNGPWRLYVADSNSGDSGSIASWALTIKARVRV